MAAEMTVLWQETTALDAAPSVATHEVACVEAATAPVTTNRLAVVVNVGLLALLVAVLVGWASVLRRPMPEPTTCPSSIRNPSIAAALGCRTTTHTTGDTNP